MLMLMVIYSLLRKTKQLKGTEKIEEEWTLKENFVGFNLTLDCWNLTLDCWNLKFLHAILIKLIDLVTNHYIEICLWQTNFSVRAEQNHL